MLLHLAMKAFYPALPPFPLLHVDTGWKFRDMITHRDAIAQRYGVKLLVYTNSDGVARGINPITSGSQLHTQVMKTEALKQALDLVRFRCCVRRRAARRREEPRQGAHLFFSLGRPWLGSTQPAARALAPVQYAPQ